MRRGSIASSAPVRCSQTILRTTVDDARDTFRRSKYCVYSASLFYDYARYLFVNICHLLTSVAEWSIQCRISRFNSASSKVRYIVLQLSRNLYLRHDFRALQTNFILKTRQQEDLQNILFLILQVYRHGSHCFSSGYNFKFFFASRTLLSVALDTQIIKSIIHARKPWCNKAPIKPAHTK
jgi:hypothetical protein